MPLLDKISDLASRFAPSNHAKPSGIANNGMGPIDDDMIVSKPTIVLHASQIFFNFLAMACFASVAGFQAKWHVGPSGLTGFALFVSISGMFLSAFMLGVPVAYERYDKFVRLARALKEVRVGFILTGTGVTFSLLIAFITTISAWTQPGCKNKDNDPHSEALGDDFKNGLPGWCSTKKAGSIFFWFAFGFWAASLVMLVLDWRAGRLHAHAHRDPPFQRPQPGAHDEEDGPDDDDDASYMHVAAPSRRYNDDSASQQSPFADPYPPQQSQRYAAGGASAYTPALQQHQHAQHQPLAGRPSMDAYGAFSDPAPSGFGTSALPASQNYPSSSSSPSSQPHSPSHAAYTGYTGSPARGGGNAPVLAEPDMGGPMVSRTMQYADPYAAVRASVGGGGGGAGKGPSSPTGGPPGYEGYSGYR